MNKRKVIEFFLIAFLLFAIDLTCTYVTFAVKGVPIAYEVNELFREWVREQGWLVSIGKFTVLKALLFTVAGWLIFRTESRITAFLFAQCAVSNHLVAISSHPTLWWIRDHDFRTLLLWLIGILSVVLTYFGIRYLRHRPPVPEPAVVCPSS
ncbi:MAG: hypothetical protein AB1898_29190 [Acidobacteriota bacterium]